MPPRPACTNQPQSLIPGGEHGTETAHHLRYLRGGSRDGGVRSDHHVGGRAEISRRFGCAQTDRTEELRETAAQCMALAQSTTDRSADYEVAQREFNDRQMLQQSPVRQPQSTMQQQPANPVEERKIETSSLETSSASDSIELRAIAAVTRSAFHSPQGGDARDADKPKERE